MTATEITPSPDPKMPWADRVIIRTEVGSTAHGTGLPGGEDYDEMGLVLERWESSVGLCPDSDEPDVAAINGWLLDCHRATLPA